MNLRDEVASKIANWFVSKITTGLPGAKDVAEDILALFSSDTARLQREAFVQGAQWFTEELEPPFTDGEYDMCEAEAARRYPEGGKHGIA